MQTKSQSDSSAVIRLEGLQRVSRMNDRQLARARNQAIGFVFQTFNLQAEGNTLIIVTHEQHIADHTRRIVRLSDGDIISDTAS